ncbi:hypothetical protein M407DRAFT_26804 [Tulasnella calospora MUT 4182]|uniref:WW domain-containing protein n=1 Tax=Tulasnella calospora MUT 4182 TaxID=1051891 RepID=A0A0C3LQN5_9AGAM|nr:hypothetical protein M407DRAFT_26804 [Tulasnella calospora MUT 4182]
MKYNRPLGREEATLAEIPRLSDGWTVIDIKDERPNGWDLHTTPEGDSYWSDCDRKIVSHADPRKPVIANLIDVAYDDVRNNIQDRDDVEIFFNTSQEAPETPTSGALEYYVVNHPTRQVFWTEDVKVDKIGVGQFSSLAQLKSALTPEYWTHMDYFPCHRAVDAAAEEELQNVLRQGAIDDMTAPGSTFPYSAKECRQYLSLIEGFKNSSGTPAQSAYKTSSIARIWASITRVRHINGYGLKNPRLDRLQGLGDYSSLQAGRSFKLGLVELLCFNVPRQLFTSMTALWNGRIVYQRHWHKLFDELRRGWELIALIRSGLATASDISAYISYAESYRYGLRGLSIVLSLPRALTIWAILLLQVGLASEVITHNTNQSQWVIVALTVTIPMMVILPALSFFRHPV